MPDQAKDGDVVRVHYTGRLESGEVFDSSAGSDPLEFHLGAGQVIPGFEEGVRGMRVGERRTVEIAAEDAYGERREGLVQQVPRSLMGGAEPHVGMQVLAPMQDGSQLPLTITEVSAEQITVDANHPLAGQKLIFDLELVEIR